MRVCVCVFSIFERLKMGLGSVLFGPGKAVRTLVHPCDLTSGETEARAGWRPIQAAEVSSTPPQ